MSSKSIHSLFFSNVVVVAVQSLDPNESHIGAKNIPGDGFIRAHSEACGIIPRQICNNAAIDIVHKLRKRHAAGKKWFGEDVDGTENIRDNMEAFICGPPALRSSSGTQSAVQPRPHVSSSVLTRHKAQGRKHHLVQQLVLSGAGAGACQGDEGDGITGKRLEEM
ncbi:hypothetical protein EV702DRAFT_1048015 [Suillus placidus]|uniref:Uncharacterized protein n=1 Tax=Suillus placidus TaxID=48579 RepID=A0A9P6ZPP2_9AGAM|nr:hypothetical protein EV702DRAFT_1048015 [Suillus placidus]